MHEKTEDVCAEDGANIGAVGGLGWEDGRFGSEIKPFREGADEKFGEGAARKRKFSGVCS